MVAFSAHSLTRFYPTPLAGGRLDPSRVRVVPLSTTFNDPFAAVVRKRLTKLGAQLEQVGALLVRCTGCDSQPHQIRLLVAACMA